MPARKRNNAPSQRKRGREPTSDHDGDNHHPTNARSGASRDITKRNLPQKISRSESHQKQLIYGSSVLVVAIIAGALWNYLDNTVDPRIVQFWSTMCREAQCARYVNPVRRTLQASRPIRSGEVIAEIPRHLQIWDIDALRNEFVREELLSARHARTGNLLPSGAFLAAYLALQYQDMMLSNVTASKDIEKSILKSYFEALPTGDELVDHPVLWSTEDLASALGQHSRSFGVVVAHKEMVASEYQAFLRASGNFADKISEEDYTIARLWVLTRSFSPGPDICSNEINKEDLPLFEKHVMLDFAKGCHAMVPILDALNHHPEPNVAYQYNADKRAFLITAKRKIPVGFELYDSYGKFSDSHLFAKFGFVNGDGSGHTQASIAFFHRMFDYGMDNEYSHFSKTHHEKNRALLSAQRPSLIRYLQYDDGYVDCITGQEEGDAYKLKELKLQHLMKIANTESRWVVTVGPRRPNSQPVESTEILITEQLPEIDPRRVRLNLLPLIETCRLISVIHTDYDGQAIAYLEQNLETSDFVLEKDNNALEYRTFMCLARLASNALMNVSGGRKVKEEESILATLTREDFGGRNWTAGHVRLGEMQTLQLISGAAFGQMQQWVENLPESIPPEYTVREKSCPPEYVEFLGKSKVIE